MKGGRSRKYKNKLCISDIKLLKVIKIYPPSNTKICDYPPLSAFSAKKTHKIFVSHAKDAGAHLAGRHGRE